MQLHKVFPATRLCAALDLARSAFYYESPLVEGADLRDEMERIALEFPHYGYRCMTAELKRRAWSANHKRVLRLMREYHLLVEVKRYCRTTFSQHTLPPWNLLGVGSWPFPHAPPCRAQCAAPT